MRRLLRVVRLLLPSVFHVERRFLSRSGVRLLTAFAGGGSLLASGLLVVSKTGIVSLSAEELQVRANHKLTKRETRFLQFSSIEYNDVIYMSPMDFVDSLTLDAPRERVYRRVLAAENVEQMLKKTPHFKKGSKNFFRQLDQNGIISYSEYLFLITLLTKSQAAFKVAFSLFDNDGNQRIDKEEFLLIRSLVNTLRSSRKQKVEDDPCQLNPADFDDLVLRLRDRLNPGADPIPHLETRDEEKKDVSVQETTILIHLFGAKGNNSLGFDQFQLFYNNLQKELMEIEFHEFSRGKSEISPMNFARLVLRYSIIHQDDYTTYINRVQERSRADDTGINMEQFEQFSLFLNNLAEFSVAVRLYTAADMPVSQQEFIRAVKCSTGHDLDPHLVDILYRIFDANGDGRLSYSEFIAVMNDRLHRGFKSNSKMTAIGWKPFRDCVVSELASF
ncbi:hypothetical protein QR680_013046 [Steinernema hermaphroditum]|uniref:EF-hand domain-containing protein n=1 Tax=Steinernema hermaphroditum TaxID=289476 RepID=A0AA39M1W7_9BILA|nr:hypothetical protein QR680_013046 [Steinernema hermaphroditum]